MKPLVSMIESILAIENISHLPNGILQMCSGETKISKFDKIFVTNELFHPFGLLYNSKLYLS